MHLVRSRLGTGIARCSCLAAPRIIMLMCLITLSSSSQALRLRLDNELKPHTPLPAHATTERLIQFGSSDLRARAAQHRLETRLVLHENKTLAEQISASEDYLLQMKDLSRVQERTLGILTSTRVLQQTTQGAARMVPAAPTVPPNMSPSAPSMPSPLALSRDSPTVSTPTVNVAGLELPHWLLPGAIGGVLTAVLGCLLMAVARRRNRHGLAIAMPALTASARSARANSESGGYTEGVEAVVDGEPSEPAVTLNMASRPVARNGDVVEEVLAGDGVDPVAKESPEPASEQAEEIDWTRTMVSRKATDPQALREVDTLIAFEQFDKAKALLDKMMQKEPDNPEYLLRHYHVRTHGGADTSHDDAEILRAMMDGPMSDTMLRVRDIGRGLMPGDPLFGDQEGRDEALKVLRLVAHTPSPDVDQHAPGVVLDPATFLPAVDDTKS